MKGLSHQKTFYYHIAGWIIFIFYESALIAFVRQRSHLENRVVQDYLLPYALNILLFYGHALVVMRYCFNGKARWILFAILFCTELFLYLLVMGLFRDNNPKEPGFFFSLYASDIDFARQLWRGIYFIIFSTAFWLIKRGFDRVRRMREMERVALLQEQEKQKLELQLITTQNAFLQAQINPHFLFNTLNFIHSEVQDVSEKASEAVIILSDMMRYSLNNNKADGMVELENEIAQIDNLIRMNQYRFDGQLQIQLVAEGEFEGARIVPLLLLPFVENLFKYADLTNKAEPVLVKIHFNSGVLFFYISNKKRRTVAFDSPGIGVENVRTRLESFYRGRFNLEIKDEGGVYSIYLTIKL